MVTLIKLAKTVQVLQLYGMSLNKAIYEVTAAYALTRSETIQLIKLVK